MQRMASILHAIWLLALAMLAGLRQPTELPARARTTPALEPRGLFAPAPGAPGDSLRFRFVTMDEALTDYRKRREGEAARLAAAIRPILRDPADMADLLSYQLVGGVTAGDDLSEEG